MTGLRGIETVVATFTNHGTTEAELPFGHFPGASATMLLHMRSGKRVLCKYDPSPDSTLGNRTEEPPVRGDVTMLSPQQTATREFLLASFDCPFLREPVASLKITFRDSQGVEHVSNELAYKNFPRERGDPPYASVDGLELKLEPLPEYVAGVDPVLLNLELSNRRSKGKRGLALHWPSERSIPVFMVTDPAGATHMVRQCPSKEDSSGVDGLRPGDSIFDPADLTGSDLCSGKGLFVRLGDYTVRVAWDLRVCDAGAKLPPGAEANANAMQIVVQSEEGRHKTENMNEDCPESAYYLPYTIKSPTATVHVVAGTVGFPAKDAPPAVADAQVAEMLRSGNPRLAAWAAYFVERDHPQGDVPLLLAWLRQQLEAKNVPAPGAWPVDDEAENPALQWRDAMAAVLDALIRSNARLDTTELKKVEHVERIPALVLGAHDEDFLWSVYRAARPLIRKEKAEGGDALSWDEDEVLRMRWYAGRMLAGLRSRQLLMELLRQPVDVFVDVMDLRSGIMSGGPTFVQPNCAEVEEYGRDTASARARRIWPPVGLYEIDDGKKNCPGDVPLVGGLRARRMITGTYELEQYGFEQTDSDGWLSLYGRHRQKLDSAKEFYIEKDPAEVRGQVRQWMQEQRDIFRGILRDEGMPEQTLALRLRSSGGFFWNQKKQSYELPKGSVPEGVTVIWDESTH